MIHSKSYLPALEHIDDIESIAEAPQLRLTNYQYDS